MPEIKSLFDSVQDVKKKREDAIIKKAKENPLFKYGSGSGEFMSAKESMDKMKDIEADVGKRFGKAEFDIMQKQQSEHKLSTGFKYATKSFKDDVNKMKRDAGFVLDLGKSIIRAIPRAVAAAPIQYSTDLYNMFENEGPDVEAVFTPRTKFEKAIFGEEPIKGMFNHQKKVEEDTYGFLSSGVINIDDPNVRKGASMALSGILVGGLTGLDMMPLGGSGTRKQVIKEVSKLENADDIFRQLQKIWKGSDDELKFLSTKLTKIKDEKQISKIFKSVDDIVKEKDKLKTADDVVKAIRDDAKTVKKKIVSQKFNKDRFNLTPDEQKRLNAIKGSIGLPDKRTVRTFEDMQRNAEDLGVGYDELLEIIGDRKIVTDKENVFLANRISSNMNYVSNNLKLLDDPTLSAVEKATIERNIEFAENEVGKILKDIIPGITEQGRALVSNKILASRTMDPAYWVMKATRNFNKNRKELLDLPIEHRRAIMDLISKNDRNGLATYVSNLYNPAIREKLTTIWKGGLLTSPPTHLANIGGNITMRGLLDSTNFLVAAPLDALASIFTGKRTTLASLKSIWAGIKSMGKGSKEAVKFFKTGVYPEEVLTKFDIPRQPNTGNKLLDTYLNGVFRSLGSGDIFFRRMAMSESLQRQAMVIAKNEGLKGAKALDRVRELLLKPTNEMAANAIDAADYATFQSGTKLGDWIATAKSGKFGGGVATSVEVTAPFTKTPINIAKTIADYSPAGFIKAMVKVAKPSTRSQKAFIEDLSRAITGTGIIAFGSYLAAKGLMTGNLPTDKRAREDFYAQGKQPNSIFFLGKWRQLNRVSPFGNLLSLGAEAQKAFEEEVTPFQKVRRTFFAGLTGLTEQTFLKGLSGGLQALTTPERSAQKWLDQTGASFVPSVITKSGNIFDPRLRNPEEGLETIKARLPYFNGSVPLQLDIWGNPVKVGGGRANIIDPFASKEGVDDPIIDEAKRLEINIGLPQQTIKNMKLTNQEFQTYQSIAGPILRDTLDILINTDEYKELNNVEKKDAFKSIISTVRSKTTEKLFPKLMILRYDLPEGINPAFVNEIITRVAQDDKDFRKMTTDAQKEYLEHLFKQIELYE